MASMCLRSFSSLRYVVILCGANNFYQDSPEDIANGLFEIASSFEQGNKSTKFFICGILPRDISSLDRLLIKETNNELKSSRLINFTILSTNFHINFIDQDTNQIQMSGSLKPDRFFFLNKLHLVEKGNFILAKSIYISMKNCYGFQNTHQLNKTYQSLTAFSLKNADFPTLTTVSPRTYSDCISVSSNKSVQNSFIKPVHKSSSISSIKTVSVVVRKRSVYNSPPGVRSECVYASVNNTI